jgi:hypothetical protein
MPDPHLLCHKCGSELQPGKGSFYVIKIEAIADPSPPNFTAEDLSRDMKAEIQRLAAEMSDLSAQEAMDQIYRKVTLYLCNACYRQWIEDPAG